MTRSTESIRNGFADDVSGAMSSAEDTLRRVGAETSDRAREFRSQVETKLGNAKGRLQDFQGEAVDRAKAAASMTDGYVRNRPWQVLGVAAIVGIAIGLLMNRRN